MHSSHFHILTFLLVLTDSAGVKGGCPVGVPLSGPNLGAASAAAAQRGLPS